MKENIALLNKTGKMLKDEPELGLVMAMRKHVYVDKLNVRKLVEDYQFVECKVDQTSPTLKICWVCAMMGLI